MAKKTARGSGKTVVIVDMDGTIADVNHRLHHISGDGKKNWKRFFQGMDRDTPIDDVIQQVRELAEEHKIVILTGRPEHYRGVSERWLEKHEVPYEVLFMRPSGDHRPDYVVKQEIVEEIGPEKIALAIDDREPVCEMFRKLGIEVQEVKSDRVNKQVNEAYRKES
jgi:uncharacterized HAD superfamily protein